VQPPTISAVIDTPLNSSSSPASIGTYTVTKYTHRSDAFIGFNDAQFTIADILPGLEYWIEYGLGCDVKVYSNSLAKCWHGFINIVKLNVAGLTITVGPLMDIANRVTVMYTGIENENYPAISLGQVRTLEKNDVNSQTKYGILPKVLSASDVTTEEAEGYRNTYLEKMKNPNISQDWSSTKKGTPNIELSCLGYAHWLNYPYGDVDTGDQNPSDKIIDILGATPNVAWLAFNTTGVITNATIVTTEQDTQDRTGLSIIKSVTAFGDNTFARWLFGIYEDLRASYGPAPTTVHYRQNLNNPSNLIFNAAGGLVYPWDVRPGRWIEYADVLIGETPPSDLRDSARFQFIESVKYTAPRGLQLKGGEVDTLAQRMAQFGLGGTS